MAATKPRTSPKRKSSVRASKKKPGLSKFQSLSIISVLAIIGVVAVVATRASGTPDYQYSASKFANTKSADSGSSRAIAQDKVNTSAEALVYRVYRGLYNRNPDAEGYRFWTQKLAGERIRITRTSLVVDQVKKMGSDTAFVKTLYRNMLKRSDADISEKEVNQWVSRLKASGDKRWSREKVVAQFAVSSEAIKKNQEGWSTYFNQANKVSVEQTAAREQYKRFDKMFESYSQPAARDKEAAEAALNTAKAQLSAAGKTAGKNAPSLSDLKAIAGNQANAGRAYTLASSRAASAAAKAGAAERLFNEAKDLGEYATDIGSNSHYGLKQIAARYRAAKSAATASASYAASTKARINDIAKKYSVAREKYEAEQRRLAEIRRRAEEEARRNNTNPAPRPANPANPVNPNPAPAPGCPTDFWPDGKGNCESHRLLERTYTNNACESNYGSSWHEYAILGSRLQNGTNLTVYQIDCYRVVRPIQ